MDCDASLFEGGSVQSEFWRLTIAQVRELIVAEGIRFPGIAAIAACGRRAGGAA